MNKQYKRALYTTITQHKGQWGHIAQISPHQLGNIQYTRPVEYSAIQSLCAIMLGALVFCVFFYALISQS